MNVVVLSTHVTSGSNHTRVDQAIKVNWLFFCQRPLLKNPLLYGQTLILPMEVGNILYIYLFLFQVLFSGQFSLVTTSHFCFVLYPSQILQMTKLKLFRWNKIEEILNFCFKINSWNLICGNCITSY